MRMGKIAAWFVLGVIAFTVGTALKYFHVPKDKPAVVQPYRPNRFFLISYTWTAKKGDDHGGGNYGFGCTKMKSIAAIDSAILSGLPGPADSYYKPIYQSVYEFKDAKDYLDFYGEDTDQEPVH